MDVNGEAEAPAGKGRKADKQKVPFYELFAFADKLDVGLMIVGTVSAVANGLANPLGTVIFGQLINTFGRSDSSNVLHEISKVSLDFLYLAIATGIASFIQVSSWMVTGERQAARIRGLYLKTILRQDIAFFDSETTTGQVIERMSGDTILIQDALGEKVGKFIQLMSTFFGAFIIAFVRGWLLTLVLLPIIPLLVILGWATTTIMSRMSAKGQLAYAEAGNVVEQTVGAIRTVASFTGEKKAIQDYDKNLHTAYASTVRQGLASGMAGGSGSLINYGGYGVAILYGSKLVMDKGYDGGQVINCIMAIVGAGFSLGEATPCLNAFAVGQAAAYKMLETIKRRPRIDAYDTRGLVLEVIRGEIELKDVHFSYPARPDIQIFSGFSLYVPNGKTAALVGQSGSGKSTVISLLERFYDPHSGEVLIDGVDLKKLQLKWIREKIGLVSQEPILFATTIKENILYGKEDASEEEINTAIMLANASKFIDKLPMGLDTMAGEHGTQLSGGQKQRIAIARAILKNPRILLLDEATSALDSVSERIVQDALVNVMLDRTTLVVAHRLTTIRGADMIAVLHQGKIVEQGTHEELIRDPDGAYNQLVCLQEGNSKTGDDHHVKDIDKVDTEGSSDSIDRIMSQKSMSSRRSASYGFSYPIPAHEAKMAGMAAQQRNIDEGGKRPPNVPLRRLAHLNKPEGLLLLMGSVGAGVSGAMAPIFGMLFSSAINTFFEPPNKMKKDSRLWGLMCIGIGVISLLNGPFKSYLFGVAGGRLIQRIRSLSFQKVVHQEISWFDDPKNSSGAVGARLSIDASTIRKLVGDALSQLVYNVSTIIAALVISFTANWILALVILILVPVMYLQGYLERRYLDQFCADAKVMYEEASQVASDAIGSIRTVASFCAEKKVMDMYQRKCLAPKKQGVRLGLVSGAGYGFSLFALGCVNALSFYVGALLVQHGKATFEQVFKVFFALTISALGLSHSGFMARDFIGARHSIASVFQLIDSKPTIDSSSNEGTTLDYVKGDIEFQHVSFKYSTRPDLQVLTDFSLSIPSEKKVALVGESGCGKSTVISLIERFYNPESGCILLDGVEIKSLKLTWLRQQIGLVGQEPVLFNETIRANIAYGRDEATEDEIVAAAKAANAHNFINALPSGYDTRVGERGTQLSGGQKQRVAIARAILKEPKILLLDEATSALDAESERVVQEALDRVMVKRTTVVVAHRLSTIKGADIIAVVKDGAVAEQGSHDELMNVVDGAYASLVALHTATATATTTTPS